MSELTFDRTPAALPLDGETLLARFDGIRQFACGGRRAPHKPLLLLYALACLKHGRQAEIRFNRTEAAVQPLLRVYGPWGASARVSYPYGRLVGDGLWQLPDRAALLDAGGNIREGVARERDAPAGFTPDVLATFEREPELIDLVALHLAGSSARDLLQGLDGQAIRLPVDQQLHPRPEHLRWHHAQVFQGRRGWGPTSGRRASTDTGSSPSSSQRRSHDPRSLHRQVEGR